MEMKKLLLLFLLTFNLGFSQVGIGTTNPDLNAVLDVTSTTKGFLAPRMTSAQRLAIGSPTESLLVYDTSASLYYYYSTTNNAWSAINIGSIKTIAATSYTLIASDSGRMLDFSATTAISLIIPDNLPIGFQVSVTQANTGGISVSGSGSMVVNNRWGASRSIGRWSKIGIEVRAANSSVISGDLQ
jgi:hypothetical protein